MYTQNVREVSSTLSKEIPGPESETAVTAETTRPARERMPRGAPSAPERAYQWLRKGIITGELAEGLFLDESWVAESVGLSRTPVREAFHRLSAEHVIDLLPRKGAQVRVVTAKELADMNATRFMIESHAAAGLCAEEVGAPDEMRVLLDPMQSAEQDGDWYQTAQLNHDFHRAMVAAFDNSVLVDLYDTLRSRQLKVGLRELHLRPGRVPNIDSEHRAIVSALEANDGPRTLKVLAHHLRAIPEIVTHLGD